MPIQRLSARDVTVLKNPGKRSEQLVWHGNAPEAAMTITRVTMEPGAISTLHAHAKSEQIWLIERGGGTLLWMAAPRLPSKAATSCARPLARRMGS
jgi:mannose-6-phosphate isomerase-like protein (cupin superfamily)